MRRTKFRCWMNETYACTWQFPLAHFPHSPWTLIHMATPFSWLIPKAIYPSMFWKKSWHNTTQTMLQQRCKRNERTLQTMALLLVICFYSIQFWFSIFCILTIRIETFSWMINKLDENPLSKWQPLQHYKSMKPMFF